ncbi:hypothetical protein D3C71_52260 [compost metagenome]
MKQLFLKIRFILTHSPVRFNVFLIGLLVWLTYRYIYPAEASNEQNHNSYQSLLVLLVKIAGLLALILIGLSLLTTILAYIRYRILNRSGRASFKLDLQTGDMQDAALHIHPTLQYDWRPFLGFISGRLRIDRYGQSKPFVLASVLRRSHSLRVQQFSGTGDLYFRDIKAYQVTGATLYFEDMFRLIRLYVPQPLQGEFYHPPQASRTNVTEVLPQAQQEMDVRIEQMRKVEGEYLNYKQFEYGDDVRRIVWKIYGRSRELVVRNPEIRNPYASECYLYASFYNHIGGLLLDDGLADEMLNYYKEAVWSLYTQLQQNDGLMIHYVSEQHVKADRTDRPEAEQVQHRITQAVWQQETTLLSYSDLQKGSVFCIHSLSDYNEVKQLLEKRSDDQYVHLVSLSEGFDHYSFSWLKRVFMKHPQPETEQRHTAWMISPQRKTILKNEAALKQLLKQYR